MTDEQLENGKEIKNKLKKLKTAKEFLSKENDYVINKQGYQLLLEFDEDEEINQYLLEWLETKETELKEQFESI